ncbi:EAL domain-containing protein (putative c-di-GMP-specific phosphodiesterase class I) [Allocatelliglobosispora scoriae]|uniref:EAL domain-containing protein (Putative c-di-GMP-specific phosphodiesterase class I) n=1 Tax=Allocatelliglobosispora scoriae TaxID=643052 RepID=A0A841BI54_9ACTN|nr:EAL domain-containing protein [Allocatelliglobosispora scoriae]MBB5866743.1 EAL domain-containing protein (putative c-di-GMP-specific phosphodiesterase class I) [Allocatelliglobosispora scoriae]
MNEVVVGHDARFDMIVRHHAFFPVFQPIVSLGDGTVVGYEALARGPAGSAFESPAALFGYAQRAGRLGELDWATRAVAFRDALAAGLPYEMPLFVNVEPATLRTACPPDLQPMIDAGAQRLQIVAEITERFLGEDPAALLMLTDRVRGRSARIALDDVGAKPASLALMSLLNPEVIKLDSSVVQSPASPAAGRVVKAVLAESARTGAVVLAEGIETDSHLWTAMSMGATLGQGWLFGRPGPLPPVHQPPGTDLPRSRWTPAAAITPFEVASRHHETRRLTKRTLLPLSSRLEAMAAHAPESMVLLATFQQYKFFTGAARARYAASAAGGAFTAAFARGMPAHPVAGVRGVALADDDPLAGEWSVIVVDSYFAGGLFARELPTTGPESEREFDAVVSHDRALVTEAARCLLQRLDPYPEAAVHLSRAGTGA